MALQHCQLSCGKNHQQSKGSFLSCERQTLNSCVSDERDLDIQYDDSVMGDFDIPVERQVAEAVEGLDRYYYTERERYLPLANITRSLKDTASYSFPDKNIKVTKSGEIKLIHKTLILKNLNFYAFQ